MNKSKKTKNRWLDFVKDPVGYTQEVADTQAQALGYEDYADAVAQGAATSGNSENTGKTP